MMIYHGAVIMAINGILINNITTKDARFNAQTQEFLTKAQSVEGLNLVAIKNEETLAYIKNHKVDFILFWDKDIFLARKLQALGYKVFNDPHAIYTCDDKALMAVALDEKKIKTPKYFVFPLHFSGNILEYYDLYKKDLLALGFPLILKERIGSFGEQVYLARTEEELINLLKVHGTKSLIAQEYLKKHSGTDYRINVVGDTVISSVKRTNKNDFRSNINQGGKAVEVSVSDDVKALAISATKAVNGHFVGVDIMFDDQNEPVVIEVNSNMRTVGVNKVSKHDLTLAILNYIIKAL